MQPTQRTTASLLGLILAVSGLACAPTHSIDLADRSQTAGGDCFNARRVRSYSALHEQYVYVRVGSHEHYLLTLDAIHFGLRFAAGITITGSFDRVCSDTGATIRYLNNGYPAYCRIVRVEAVGSKEEAEDLVKARTIPQPKG